MDFRRGDFFINYVLQFNIEFFKIIFKASDVRPEASQPLFRRVRWTINACFPARLEGGKISPMAVNMPRYIV